MATVTTDTQDPRPYPLPQIILGGRVEGGPRSPIYDHYAGVAHSLLPVMERLGLAQTSISTASPIGCAEAVAGNACIMPPLLVGA